jgi:membrane-associated phospholipid phosphatase
VSRPGAGHGWFGRPVRPAGWWFEGLLLVSLAALTTALAAGYLLDLDLAVRDWCDTHRPTALYWVARAANLLGQGTPLAVISLLLAAVLVWRRHSVRPLLPVFAAELLTNLTLGPFKLASDRAAPHADRLPPFVAHPEALGSQDAGLSYPSGHVVNTIVWYGVLAVLLAPWLGRAGRRLLRVVPPAAVCVTTTYLGFHWFTDTVAGLLLGLLLDRIMRRVCWDAVPLGRRLAATGWAGPGLPKGTGPAAQLTPPSARPASPG